MEKILYNSKKTNILFPDKNYFRRNSMIGIYPSIVDMFGTFLMTIVFVYLYYLYFERYMGLWLTSWLINLCRIVLFDSGLFNWTQSLLGFTIYQFMAIASAVIFTYGTTLFIGKRINKWWLYSGIVIFFLTEVFALLQVPIIYRMITFMWFCATIYIWAGISFIRHLKLTGLGKKVTGYTYIIWGIHALNKPFLFEIPAVAIWGYLIGDTLRLLIAAGTLIIYFEKTRADLISNQESLQQANQELNYFCHSVAHDFKAPLQSINKLSQYLIRDYADKVDSNGKELITHIQNKSAEVVGITDHLLELSRMSQKQIAMKDIKLEPLFREVYDELIELQPERQVLFKIKQLPMIHGDPIMIKILVANILSNALKYTRNRKQAIIEVTSVENENDYIISVKDNGAGFDMSESSRLFQIFERLHSVDQFEGTGVGLVVCQKILKRHNGRAWLTGKVNQGAVFSFSFPKNLLL
jgi:signal transduction histidine kinase